MNSRLTLVCQWYPPEPAAVPESLALGLREVGFDVSVLTGIPNYPTGEVAEGYKATSWTSETINGIPINRTPLYPSHDSRAIKRLVNYVSWALSSAALGQRLLRNSDVALVYSSPATAALPAMVARILWGTPFVLLVQDLWPDPIFASGFMSSRIFGPAHRALDLFVGRAYAMASHIAVSSPGMVNLIASRGVPLSKLSVAYNWLPEVELAHLNVSKVDALRAQLSIPVESRIFLYAGNHGRAQALGALVGAFAEPSAKDAHLVLLGSGVAKCELRNLANGNPRVHFLDPVSRGEAARLTSSADVHVVSLADLPLFAATMPSKVQSGLAAGIPMLVISRGDSADLVTTVGAGLSAEPGNVRSIASAVARLSALAAPELARMGARGKATYEGMMAREIGASRLAATLNRAAQSERGLRRWRQRSHKGAAPEQEIQ